MALTGEFSGLLMFDRPLRAQGSTHMFLVEYDPQGNVLWSEEAGGTGDNSRGNGVTIEPDGSVVVVGTLSGSAAEHFIDTAGQELIMPSYSGEFGGDMVLVHYDPAGRLLWATHAGFPFDTMYGLGVAHDADGNIYVSGLFTECAMFPRQALQLGHTRPLSPFSPDNPPPCASTPADEALSTTGFTDQFLAKYDLKGNLQWVQLAGGPGIDKGAAVSVLHAAPGAPGFIYLGGTIEETASFGRPPMQQSVTAMGSSAHSIAKYTLNRIFTLRVWG